MCGIVGFVSSKQNKDLIDSVTKSMVHRGPDDLGKENLGDLCLLGQRRLSIIDISENGRQPFTEDSRGISICVNGEIYNFLELKKELQNLVTIIIL